MSISISFNLSIHIAQSCEQVGRDLGALYNIVFIFWWLVFTCMLYPCAVQLKEHYQKMSRRKAGFKLDFKFLVIFLVLISCGARTLWLIDPHPNSTPFGFHIWRRSYGGQMWVHLLLKVPCARMIYMRDKKFPFFMLSLSFLSPSNELFYASEIYLFTILSS